jgi:(R)-2-hydroxyacyl-CoA dehydratese activating ATPase
VPAEGNVFGMTQHTGYFAGIDIGSTMTKAVIMDEGIISSVIGPTGPEQRTLAHHTMERALDLAGIPFKSIAYLVATGYGRINVPFADKQITEISCHARGVLSFFPHARTIIDIGGQDSKAISINNGKPVDFIMNDKCAAGCGRFLEVIADSLGLGLEEMDEISLKSANPARISNMCTVFAEQEVIAKLAGGIPVHDLAAGIYRSLAERIVNMARRIKIASDLVITGGGAKMKALTKAISDGLNLPVSSPAEPLLTGAVGAAMLGRDIMDKALKEGSMPETKERSLVQIVVS